MKIQIKNRFTSAIIFETEVDDSDTHPMRTALEKAVAADADLAGAYLAHANLAGADLAHANLADAYLADAYLAGAENVPDGTEKTDPPMPYVRATTPVAKRERLARRAQEYREKHPEVPVVPMLDAKILKLLDDGKGILEMGSWHGGERENGTACGTTHCRAGWSIMLAGEAGLALEKQFGPEEAGRRIYLASTGRVPHFYASNDRALADIKRCAEEQTETTDAHTEAK